MTFWKTDSSSSDFFMLFESLQSSFLSLDGLSFHDIGTRYIGENIHYYITFLFFCFILFYSYVMYVCILKTSKM